MQCLRTTCLDGAHVTEVHDPERRTVCKQHVYALRDLIESVLSFLASLRQRGMPRLKQLPLKRAARGGVAGPRGRVPGAPRGAVDAQTQNLHHLVLENRC